MQLVGPHGVLSSSWQLFQGYFAGERGGESRRKFIALFRSLHHRLSAAIVLFRNRGSLFPHFVQGSPTLVFECYRNAPVIGKLRHTLGVELIVHNPTLLF